MKPTDEQLWAVLAAAELLLGARRDQMLTVEEWVGLARSVAACTGMDAASLLTADDLARPGPSAAENKQPA